MLEPKRADALDDGLHINFASAWPEYMSNTLTVYLQNGLVQKIGFYTPGLQVQALMLATLKEKFGGPTEQTVEKVSNRMGAMFEIVNASWKFSDGAVLRFFGSIGRIDAGRVDLTSATQEQADQERERQLAAGRPRL